MYSVFSVVPSDFFRSQRNLQPIQQRRRPDQAATSREGVGGPRRGVAARPQGPCLPRHDANLADHTAKATQDQHRHASKMLTISMAASAIFWREVGWPARAMRSIIRLRAAASASISTTSTCLAASRAE